MAFEENRAGAPGRRAIASFPRIFPRVLLAALLLVCAAHSALGATWFSVGPSGGDARAFASDPKDHTHIFLGTATGWIYDSRDGGATWVHLARIGRSDDLVIDNILVDPRDSKHILAGAWAVGRPDGGLFASRDGGATWTANKEMAGQSVLALAEAPSDPEILVAGSLEGVFRSGDGGEHWARISPAGSKEIHEIESLAIDPKDPQAIYAGTWHLPWKTTDGGEHWRNIKDGVIDDSDVFSIIVDPATPQTVYASACSGIYKSENGGELFRKVQGIPATSRRTRVLMQDPRNPQIVFAGTTEGLYRTADGGATWRALTSSDVIVNDISIDSSDSHRMLVATDRGGVLASKDGGVTFDPSNRGFSARQITSLVANPRQPGVMYAGVVNDKQWGGVFASPNGGITWSQRSFGLDGRDVFALAWSPDGELLAGTNRGIFRLKDETWTESDALADEKRSASRAKSPIQPRRSKKGPAADNGRASKTRGGVSPSRAETAATDSDKIDAKGQQPVGQVYALASGGETMYAATSGGMLRSADSGASWSKLSVSGADAEIRDWRYLAVEGDALFVAGTERAAISFDGGKNWKLLSLPRKLTGIVAIAVDASGGLWVGGREGLFMSGNQGDTWEIPPGFVFNNVNSVYYDSANKRILATNGTSMAFSIELRGKSPRTFESGWDLRFVRPAGDHLIGASLFDGLVIQPRMVESPEGAYKR